jgi:hypothetical protein
MSLGAWIFLSVVVFVVAPILFSALAFVFLLWKGKKLVRKLEKDLNEFDKQ